LKTNRLLRVYLHYKSSYWDLNVKIKLFYQLSKRTKMSRNVWAVVRSLPPGVVACSGGLKASVIVSAVLMLPWAPPLPDSSGLVDVVPAR
jgi:hypothetical protein